MLRTNSFHIHRRRTNTIGTMLSCFKDIASNLLRCSLYVTYSALPFYLFFVFHLKHVMEKDGYLAQHEQLQYHKDAASVVKYVIL